MNKSEIDTPVDFLEYIVPYGTHVKHMFGRYCIEKTTHLTSENSMDFKPNITFNDKRYEIYFSIDGKSASTLDCFLTIKKVNKIKNRNKKLSRIINNHE